MRLLLVLTLVAFVSSSCAIISGSKNKGDERKKRGTVPRGTVPSKIPVNLLPTLAVGVDSCYVFLRPNLGSDFFGPLVKGENINRIDATKYWFRVWIPRLRISGWVRKTKVYAVNKASSDEDSVPTEQLIILNVVKRRVNVRKAPTTKSRIIFKVKQRQEYVMLDAKRGWYQIWLPQIKKKGWISKKLVVRQRKR